MSGSTERVRRAFAFERPDRTPLFEIFQPYHPIHWPICGRTVATDAALAWDAMADGIAWEELVEATAQAEFQVNRFFGVDMVRLNGAPGRQLPAPEETRRRALGTGRHAVRRQSAHENGRAARPGPGRGRFGAAKRGRAAAEDPGVGRQTGGARPLQTRCSGACRSLRRRTAWTGCTWARSAAARASHFIRRSC